MKYIIPAMIMLVMLSCSSGTEYVILPGEKIHHHGYEYSVKDLIITRFLKNGNDTLHAKGMFYIVEFRVDNNKRHSSHEWDNSIAYITDERAGTFENLPAVQEFYELSHPFGLNVRYLTKPGTSDSTYLAFDLPFNVTMPYLKVKGKILPADILDGKLFRRVRVKLY